MSLSIKTLLYNYFHKQKGPTHTCMDKTRTMHFFLGFCVQNKFKRSNTDGLDTAQHFP